MHVTVTTNPDKTELFSRLIDHADVGIYRLTIQGGVPLCAYVNAAIWRWLGQTPQTPHEPFDWLEYLHPADRVHVRQSYLNVYLMGRTERIEYRLSVPGQDPVYVTDIAVPMPDETGDEIAGICGCVQNITAQKAAQQELERTQLLQSLGRLIAGIGHEINTPIQFIGDNLHFLSEGWQTIRQCLESARQPDLSGEAARPAAARQNLEYIVTEFPKALSESLEGVERMAALVSAMRDFSHIDERRMGPGNINRAISSALTILRNELKYVTDVQADLEPQLPQAECSIDEMSQVFLNLLTNAGHSIAEKIEQGLLQRGMLRIQTRADASHITIVISDNGMGIPAEIQNRIYERFFTTKRNHPHRRGTGQGLSMVYVAVVDHHHGQISFTTEPLSGTTFTISLPIRQNKQLEI